MCICVRIHRNTFNMYTDCCKHTQDENMVIRSTLKHTCTHQRTRMHKHTHAPMNTRTNSCFQHAEAVWKTTSSQWVKHILFIYCSLKQASRALSLHTHVFCVCVSVRTCGCAYIKKFKRDRERNLFFHVWIKTKCTFRRVNLCTCKLQETFYDVFVSVYICV